MSTQTLTKSDPTGVGPLYGVELGLVIYHVLESGFRGLFKPKPYNRHLGFHCNFYDCRRIEDLMGKLLGPVFTKPLPPSPLTYPRASAG